MRKAKEWIGLAGGCSFMRSRCGANGSNVKGRNVLEWIDNRWHCDGVGIHAGQGMELRGEKQWHRVRIESADAGQILIAYMVIDGIQFSYRIWPESDRLRWPD